MSIEEKSKFEVLADQDKRRYIDQVYEYNLTSKVKIHPTIRRENLKKPNAGENLEATEKHSGEEFEKFSSQEKKFFYSLERVLKHKEDKFIHLRWSTMMPEEKHLYLEL